MDNTWYYAEGDKTVGPLSLTDIRTILSRVSNAGSVFVWRDGFTTWVRADSVPELAPYVVKPPPLPVSQRTVPPAPPAKILPRDADVTTQVRRSSSDLHPWRRYFARMFDLNAFVLIFSFFLGIVFPELFQTTDRGIDSLLWFGGVAAYVVFETICLNTFGRTFGKFLYGIQIKMKEADQIAFLSALKRSFFVWMRGLGFGVPLITLVTLIVAYSNLRQNGQTSWDRDFKFSVLHTELSALRWFGIAIAWLLLLSVWGILFVIGSS